MPSLYDQASAAVAALPDQGPLQEFWVQHTPADVVQEWTSRLHANDTEGFAEACSGVAALAATNRTLVDLVVGRARDWKRALMLQHAPAALRLLQALATAHAAAASEVVLEPKVFGGKTRNAAIAAAIAVLDKADEEVIGRYAASKTFAAWNKFLDLDSSEALVPQMAFWERLSQRLLSQAALCRVFSEAWFTRMLRVWTPATPVPIVGTLLTSTLVNPASGGIPLVVAQKEFTLRNRLVFNVLMMLRPWERVDHCALVVRVLARVPETQGPYAHFLALRGGMEPRLTQYWLGMVYAVTRMLQVPGMPVPASVTRASTTLALESEHHLIRHVGAQLIHAVLAAVQGRSRMELAAVQTQLPPLSQIPVGDSLEGLAAARCVAAYMQVYPSLQLPAATRKGLSAAVQAHASPVQRGLQTTALTVLAPLADTKWWQRQGGRSLLATCVAQGARDALRVMARSVVRDAVVNPVDAVVEATRVHAGDPTPVLDLLDRVAEKVGPAPYRYAEGGESPLVACVREQHGYVHDAGVDAWVARVERYVQIGKPGARVERDAAVDSRLERILGGQPETPGSWLEAVACLHQLTHGDARGVAYAAGYAAEHEPARFAPRAVWGDAYRVWPAAVCAAVRRLGCDTRDLAAAVWADVEAGRAPPATWMLDSEQVARTGDTAEMAARGGVTPREVELLPSHVLRSETRMAVLAGVLAPGDWRGVAAGLVGSGASGVFFHAVLGQAGVMEHVEELEMDDAATVAVVAAGACTALFIQRAVSAVETAARTYAQRSAAERRVVMAAVAHAWNRLLEATQKEAGGWLANGKCVKEWVELACAMAGNASGTATDLAVAGTTALTSLFIFLTRKTTSALSARLAPTVAVLANHPEVFPLIPRSILATHVATLVGSLWLAHPAGLDLALALAPWAPGPAGLAALLANPAVAEADPDLVAAVAHCLFTPACASRDAAQQLARRYTGGVSPGDLLLYGMMEECEKVTMVSWMDDWTWGSVEGASELLDWDGKVATVSRERVRHTCAAGSETWAAAGSEAHAAPREARTAGGEARKHLLEWIAHVRALAPDALVYDPRFVLALGASLVTRDETLDARGWLETGLAQLAVATLGTPHLVRLSSAACTALHAALDTAPGMARGDAAIVRTHLGNALHSLPLLHTTARVLGAIVPVLANPGHFMYEHATRAVLASPSVGEHDIPLFRAVASGGGEYFRECVWMMQALQGADPALVVRRGVAEWVQSVAATPHAPPAARHMAAVVLGGGSVYASGCAALGVVEVMVEEAGLVGEYGRLLGGEVVLREVVGGKRLGEWSGGDAGRAVKRVMRRGASPATGGARRMLPSSPGV